MKDFWNDRYQSTDFLYGSQPNDFLLSQSYRFKEKSRVLCIADGDGRNSLYLAKLGHQVTSVDFSPIACEKTKISSLKENVDIEVICADLADYDFGCLKWDVIVSIFAHLPSAIRKQIHSKIGQGLKVDGLLILEAYTPKQLQFKTGGPSDEDWLLNSEKLKHECEHLETILLSEQERMIQEGKLHSGQSAVVQFIGKKSKI